jgi:hypothetical protein
MSQKRTVLAKHIRLIPAGGLGVHSFYKKFSSHHITNPNNRNTDIKNNCKKALSMYPFYIQKTENT